MTMRAPSLRLVIKGVFGLMAVVLAAACAVSAVYTWQRWRAAIETEAIVRCSRELSAAMQAVRHERGVLAAALERGGVTTAQERAQILESRGVQANALGVALAGLDAAPSLQAHLDASMLRREDQAFEAAQTNADRILFDTDLRPTGAGASTWVAADDRYVAALTEVSSRLSAIARHQEEFLGRMISYGRLSWMVRSSAGDASLILHSAYLRHRPLTADEREASALALGKVDGAWASVVEITRLADTPAEVKAAVATAQRRYFDEYIPAREKLVADLDAGRPLTTSGPAWLSSAGPALSGLSDIGITAYDVAARHAHQQAQLARERVFEGLLLTALLIAAGWTAGVFMIRRYVRPLNEAADALRRLADGDHECALPSSDRADEIGDLARALAVFRENALARAHAERELRRAEVEREAAEEASRLKSQFLANMSHEIRTPLNGVLGMVQAMESEDATPRQLQRLRIIRDSGETLLQVLNDVLDFSKIEAGKLELHPEPFDLGELARRATAIFADTAAAKGLDLACKVTPGAEGVWEGDPARLRQMLMNLLSNAVKFTRAGKVRLEVGRVRGGLRIAVQDTGPGIDPAHLPRLFGKFSQVDGTVTREFGGAGLGLAICRELAVMMGGEVGVTSVPGQGSTFILRLPLKRLGDRPAATVEAAGGGDHAPARPPRILAAEDNPINQKVLAALMEPLGSELTMVDSGLDAIEAWRTGQYDLILMDIQMPGMSGVEATLTIRALEAAERRPRTPIVAVSANAMQHQMDEYRAAGMEFHVAKPIQTAALYAAIEAALDMVEEDPARALAG